MFANIVFNSSGITGRSSYYAYYSLDESSWSQCGDTLRLGPLPFGVHVLRVRTLTSNDFSTYSAYIQPAHSSDAVVTWESLSASDTSVILVDVADGLHSLRVTASDAVGHVEVAPQTYEWIVDTLPPQSNAQLLSAPSPTTPRRTLALQRVAAMKTLQPSAHFAGLCSGKCDCRC